MKIKLLAFVVGLAILGFVGVFIWAALRPSATVQTTADGVGPTASASEKLPEGNLEIQVFDLGDRNVRLEIQFMPAATDSAGLRPDVIVAMLNMQMDGFNPPLELVEAGVWRARLRLPMAGRWVASVGFGEERAEVEFDAN